MATLPTGQISIADINTEFGLGTNLGAYRGVTWYTDAGGTGTFTNTNLGMDQFWGKRATPAVSLTGSPASGSAYDDLDPAAPYSPAAQAVLSFFRNGTYQFSGRYSSSIGGSWVSPTSATVGDGFWIRFTRTATAGSSGTSTASSGWLQINDTRLVSVQRNTGSGVGFFASTYTIEFSNNGGSTVLQTLTNITLTAEHAGL